MSEGRCDPNRALVAPLWPQEDPNGPKPAPKKAQLGPAPRPTHKGSHKDPGIRGQEPRGDTPWVLLIGWAPGHWTPEPESPNRPIDIGFFPSIYILHTTLTF